MNTETTQLDVPDSLATVSLVDIDVLVLSPLNDSCDNQNPQKAYASNRTRIEEHLAMHGVVLFRDFNVPDAHELKRFAEATSDGLFGYVNGNSPRTTIEEGVYTATEFPPEVPVSLHNELSYCSEWPSRLYFGCPQPASVGGVAVFADSRIIYSEIPDAILDEFELRKGVRYVRNLPSSRGLGPTWQQTFETDSLDDVRTHCKRNVYDLEEFDDSIRISNTARAVIQDASTGRLVWFNQADQFHLSGLPENHRESLQTLFKGREDQLPQNALFGDGTEIPLDFLDTIRSCLERCTRTLSWQPRDVLLINNEIIAHGRYPFTPPRQLFVTLTK